jgi:GNAT superfamily N-acetyltransferase
MNDLSIRTMRPDEISIAVNWAAAEGWNPSLADDACFAAVDPEGFLIGELDGAPAATVSCVNYSTSFAFLGFYIVREDLRGRGYGLRIWDAAIAHAGPRVIGLDGVVAQQQNYRKSGFELAYANVRYGGIVAAPDAPEAGIVALAEVPLAAVEAYDATVFPAPRPAFLRAWIGSPGHVGCALMRDGGLVGWGVIRPCRKGCKIGPLVADDRATAEVVLSALLASVGGGEIFLDVPSINRNAVALAQDLGLVPVFETARMYTGAILPLRLERVFGVTTFERVVSREQWRCRTLSIGGLLLARSGRSSTTDRGARDHPLPNWCRVQPSVRRRGRRRSLSSIPRAAAAAPTSGTPTLPSSMHIRRYPCCAVWRSGCGQYTWRAS